MVIRFVTADSPLGRMLVARTEKGICAVAFGDGHEQLEGELRERFPHAPVEFCPEGLRVQVAAVLGQMEEAPPCELPELDVPGTEFQQRAWAAMRAIPRGETLTYQELAVKLGTPKGQVAVGQTCSRNPVAVLIPCHRVVAQGGKEHHYRWGLERKRQLLDIERRQAGKAPLDSEPEQGWLALEQ